MSIIDTYFYHWRKLNTHNNITKFYPYLMKLFDWQNLNEVLNCQRNFRRNHLKRKSFGQNLEHFLGGVE